MSDQSDWKKDLPPWLPGRRYALQGGYDSLMEIISRLAGTDARKMMVPPERRESLEEMRRREAHEVAVELEKTRKQQRQAYIDKVHSEGRIEARWTFQTLIEDALNRDAITYAKTFVRTTYQKNNSEEPKLFLLFGAEGTGKTVICNAMANAYLSAGVRSVQLVPFEAIRNACMFFREELRGEKEARDREWETYCTCDILMVDGLCSNREGLTLYDQRIFSNLLRTRYQLRLPMVITTTAHYAGGMQKAVGEYVYESIREYEVLAMTLAGNSRRKPIQLRGQRVF